MNEPVAVDGEDPNLAEFSRKFGISTRTAAVRLVHRSIPLRRRGLATEDTPQAVLPHESGLRLGISWRQ